MSTTKITIIIPARLASTRFPEKMLAARTGTPLVQHVVEAASRAECSSRVVVASDHQRIIAALAPFGTRALMTRVDHPNGTSRLSEAATQLRLSDDEIVVNVQGDEPELDARVIDATAKALTESPWASVSTAAAAFASGEDPHNPNIVKLVRAIDGRALYFSRSLIPFDRDGRKLASAMPLRHVGIYAYRVGFLHAYAKMAPTPLEQSEQLEQLRVLEHGHAIAVAVVDASMLGAGGIDTPEQYEAFVKRRQSGST